MPAPAKLRDPAHFLAKAAACRAEGKTGEAVKILRRGLKFHPADLSLTVRLGALELSLGQHRAAIRVFRTALKVHSGQPDLLYHLGFAHLAIGESAQAQACLEPVVAAHPDFLPALEAMGSSLLAQSKHAQALDFLRRALETVGPGPAGLPLHLLMISALQNLSRIKEAFSVLATAKTLAPPDAKLLLIEAQLHADVGDTEATEACLGAIIERDPDNVDAFIQLNKIKTREVDPGALERIGRFLADRNLDSGGRVTLHFLAGDLLDRAKRFDEAFPHFDRANRLQREKNGPFDMKAHLKRVERTKAVFTPDLFARLRSLGSDSPRPIFILGMPRSGTSLAEQILARHPEVHGAGEREEIRLIADGLADRIGSPRPFPDCVEDLDARTIRELAEDYLVRVSEGVNSALRITDKMPRNFLDVGLIRLMFPDAPIVHCTRDPASTCLSCFMNNFGSRQKFSNSLSDLARYYESYREIMAHWDAVLEAPVHHLSYEELVSDPEARIPALVDYCGLSWDERCLSPHKADRQVATASRWQVRRPIYKTSVSRADHYAAFLGELKRRLG